MFSFLTNLSPSEPSEKLFKLIFDHSPEAIVVLNALGDVLLINDKVYEWLGYKPDEIVGKNILNLPILTFSSKKTVINQFRLRIQGEKVQPYECEFLTKDKQIRYGRIKGSPIHNKDKKVIGSIALISDITAEKRKQEKSIQKEHLLEAVSYAAQHFLKAESWQDHLTKVLKKVGETTEVDRVIIFVNNMLGEYFEWNHEHTVSCVDVLDEGFRKKALSSWQQDLKNGKVIQGNSIDFTPAKSEVLQKCNIESIVIVPIFIGEKWWGYLTLHDTQRQRVWSNSEVRLLSTLSDIIASAVQNTNSELELRKTVEYLNLEKEKVLQEVQNTKKFQQAVDSATDGVIITDVIGKTVYANASYLKMVGYELEDLLDKRSDFIVKTSTSKLVFDNLIKTISEGKSYVSEDIIETRKDGMTFPVRLSVFSITEKDKPLFFVGIQEDITRRQEVDKMKTEFISIASHQLNTPLSAVKWFLDLLDHGKAGKLNPKQKEFLRNISEANARMISLVRSLLNVSRIELGRIIIDPTPTDLKEFIHDITQEVMPLTEQKKQKIVVHIEPKLPKYRMDRKLIRHVFVNLLTNASKYSPEKKSIVITIKRKDGKLFCSVKDDGYGIPKLDQPKLFTKFFRASNVVKLETDGSGLGLYLVKIVVESSGGQLGVKSKENEGTEIWFTLPEKGVKAKKGEVSLDQSTFA